MTTDTVIRTDREGIATLTLHRPDKYNALNLELLETLDRHIGDISARQDEIGVVVLRGSGRSFSAGHDLGDISGGETLESIRYQSGVVERLANLPQPLIVAVHGVCYTGALELALAGDLLVAAESARFADTHAKWALAPVWGMSQRLPRRVGRAKAIEMMLTCASYSGSQALEIGLVNRCVPDAELDEAVDGLAHQILANSWHSLRAIKALLHDTDGLPIDQGLAHEVYRGRGEGPDMGQRVEAFLNRSSR